MLGAISAPRILTCIAAAHAALGETDKEQTALRALRNAAKDSWVAGWLQRSFKDPRDIEGLLAVLVKAGHAG